MLDTSVPERLTVEPGRQKARKAGRFATSRPAAVSVER
jgi:hypothetical protein